MRPSLRRRGLRAAILLIAILGVMPRSVRAHFGDPVYLNLPYAEGFSSDHQSDRSGAQLAYLVERAATLVSSHGDTLLPGGTKLDRYELDPTHLLYVWLTMPAGAGFEPLADLRAASIDHVLSIPFVHDPQYRGLSVRIRIGSADYRSMGSYLPRPATPLGADAPVRESKSTSATSALRNSFMAPATTQNPEQGISQQSLGGPVANSDGQPAGALSGVIVYINGGHGWTADTAHVNNDIWFTQRPLLLNMCEDYGNLDQINLFAQYCYNAGAVVVPFRPVGYQSIEIVLDNDDTGVTYTGSWTDSTATSEYYENHVVESGVPYRFASASLTETATARYTPTIATTGFYPVYCWTRDGTDRVLQTYRVHHSGGTASIRIDHRWIGKGWIWLGSFYFDAGSSGYVEISNQAADAGVVIADAIRFGNGLGDIVRPGPNTVSGFPREEECARYWAQSEAGNHAVGMPSSIWDNSGLDDQSDNVGTAARWAAAMNRTDVSNDRWRRIYIEYHSNAFDTGAQGNLCLIESTNPTTNQSTLANLIGNKMEADLIALNSLWEYPFLPRTNTLTGSYGAISTNANANEFDATLIEVAFHDNNNDAANLRNVKFRDAVARTTVQGVIQFLHGLAGSQVPLAYSPDAPTNVRATHDGSGNIVLSWVAAPSGNPNGDAPTGYRIYRSSNGYGFGQAVDAGNVLSATLSDIAVDTTTYLRVSAYNAGGESMPSETLAVRRAATGHSQVLIVNGFDRVSRFQNSIQNIPAGPMERQIPRKVNSFDYIVQYANALSGTGLSFDATSNEAVIAGTVPLAGYSAVVWILGRESTADKTFDATEQSLVTTYLGAGGRLFLSGTDIGYDLDNQANGVSFYRNTLKGQYLGDDSSSMTVAGSGGCLAGLANFSIDPANGALYAPTAPDRIIPQAGAANIASYVGGSADGAGIQYDSGTYRVVMLAFPFECIASSSVRADVMSRVMNYLLASSTACTAALITSFEGYTDGSEVMFRSPNTSSVTVGNLGGPPLSSLTTSLVPAADGTKSDQIRWRFKDTTTARWLLLTTQNATNLPNPAIDLRRAVRLRLRFETPVGAQLRLGLGVRETGVDVPIGANGGTTGTIEWLGVSSVNAGVPQGMLITANAGVWQTITFTPEPAFIRAYTGDGVLSAPNHKGTIEHLAFTVVNNAGPFNVYLDQFEQPCPVSADFDGDGDVDMLDFAHFQLCLSGPNVPQTDPNCLNARLDADADVDDDDYTKFENCLAGPDIFANLNCAD